MFLEQEAAIEAILFAAGEAVELTKLANCIGQDLKTAKLIMQGLMDKYNVKRHGIHIAEIGESYQMCTNPDYFSYVQQLVEMPGKRVLTQTLLETLAIIAYKQPITKAQIEEIRGVNADHAVYRLMEYNLVIEKGRQDSPGRPILFGTSDEFLKHFGFSNLSRLPLLSNDMAQLTEEAEETVGKIL